MARGRRQRRCSCARVRWGRRGGGHRQVRHGAGRGRCLCRWGGRHRGGRCHGFQLCQLGPALFGQVRLCGREACRAFAVHQFAVARARRIEAATGFQRERHRVGAVVVVGAGGQCLTGGLDAGVHAAGLQVQHRQVAQQIRVAGLQLERFAQHQIGLPLVGGTDLEGSLAHFADGTVDGTGGGHGGSRRWKGWNGGRGVRPVPRRRPGIVGSGSATATRPAPSRPPPPDPCCSSGTAPGGR